MPTFTDSKGRQTRGAKTGDATRANLEALMPTADEVRAYNQGWQGERGGIASPTTQGLALIEHGLLNGVLCGPCARNVFHRAPCRGYNCNGGVCECPHLGAVDGC